MKLIMIVEDVSLENFKAVAGATRTKDRILEFGKEEEFNALIEELYPDGIDETYLNNLLWFDSDCVYESLGMPSEDEEEEMNVKTPSEEEQMNFSEFAYFNEFCNNYADCKKCPLFPPFESNGCNVLCEDLFTKLKTTPKNQIEVKIK